jgi:hypothetical protein
VVLDHRFGATVVTINQTLCVPELLGHGLAFNRAIQISERRFHVGDGLTADRTTEGGFRIFRQAFVVETMTTSHHNHSLRGGEHVISTNGTVALGGSLDTAMGVLPRDRQAYRTCLDNVSVAEYAID